MLGPENNLPPGLLYTTYPDGAVSRNYQNFGYILQHFNAKYDITCALILLQTMHLSCFFIVQADVLAQMISTDYYADCAFENPPDFNSGWEVKITNGIPTDRCRLIALFISIKLNVNVFS